MRKQLAGTLLVAMLATTLPAGAEQHHPDNNGGSHPAPAAHSAPAPQRPAPQPQRPAPQPPAQHFPLQNDLRPAPPAPQPQRPAPQVQPGHPAPQHPAPQAQPQRPQPQQRRVQPMPHPVSRPPMTHVHAFGGTQHGRPVQNPRWHHQGNWYWNRGIAWQPAPAYWGGGFWGPFSWGDLVVALLGAYVWENQSYLSYQVAPDSPGAQLLAAYQLTQTPCGPPDLVVIWGPDNSVVCAYPNNLVGEGQYTIDPTTLTLVSSSN